MLRREPDGSHVLVTPVEKLASKSRRPPSSRSKWRAKARAKTAASRSASTAATPWSSAATIPLTVVEDEHGPQPRVLVRHGLEATLARPLYYELAEIALAEAHDPPGVWSDGCFFPLTPAP